MKKEDLYFTNLLDKVNFENNAWKNFLALEFQKPYFLLIQERYLTAIKNNQIIYPTFNNLFKAYELADFDNTKVVIIGQDPYFNEHQANGLAFSVFNDVKTPPSLRNIFKELENEYHLLRTVNDLSDWAKQGVLLLNSILTVYKKQPLSCADWGWQNLLKATISFLNDNKEHIVFLLWGNYAKEFLKLINVQKHRVIFCAHPSPLSAHRGFFGANCFQEVNDDLIKNQLAPIKWISSTTKDDKI